MSVSVLTKIEVQKVCESVGERRGLCWDSRAPSGGLLMQINLNVYWTDDFKHSLMYFKLHNSVWKSRQIEYLKNVFHRKLQIASPGRCLSVHKLSQTTLHSWLCWKSSFEQVLQTRNKFSVSVCNTVSETKECAASDVIDLNTLNLCLLASPFICTCI